MGHRHSLSELQLAIVRVIWTSGQATVSEVHAALEEERNLAPTTVATLLNRMVKADVLERVKDGRRYVYRALVAEEEVQQSMIRTLTDRLFAGNTGALLAHLVKREQVSDNDLDALETLIAEAREARDA
jgi:BlaI family transcriptional regulator, penicillinase repressor